SIAFRKFRWSGLIAELGEPRSQRVAAGMLSEDEPAARPSHFFRQNNLVWERIFQDAVLVNARFVGERICANHGFVRRHGYSSDRGEQSAGSIDFFEANIRWRAEPALPDVKRDRDFFERRVSGTFADSVDRAFHLARARGDRGQRIGNGEAEVIVAVRAEDNIWMRSKPRTHDAKHFAIFVGR